MAILALDLGARRVGVAVNPTGELVLELPTVHYQEPAELIQVVQGLIDEYQATTLVVGVPRGQQDLLHILRDELQRGLPNLTIAGVDETLSTKEAERQLGEEGASRKSQDSDARAARLILEQYLSERGTNG